jgi:peroxiredoxin
MNAFPPEDPAPETDASTLNTEDSRNAMSDLGEAPAGTVADGPPSSGLTDPAAPGGAPPREDAPRSRTRWIAAAVAALGVALFAVPLLRGPNATIESGGTCATSQGAANLDFTLKDTNGADVRLSDYKGKVVLLNFWATWCGPCKLEIPEFVDAYGQYRDRGFVILGVLSEDDPTKEELHAFMTDFKMNYPVFRAHEGVETAFGPLWALPTTFLVDRRGSICMTKVGPVSKEMLEREIKGLL